MLKSLRRHIIDKLWKQYRINTPQIRPIEQAMKEKGITSIPFDHFAIIDLPSPHSGIPVLTRLFKTIGYHERGNGYLPDKQNDFRWLAEMGCEENAAEDVLPQVVVADFRLNEMPIAIKKIIEKYTEQSKPICLDEITQLANLSEHDDLAAKCLEEKIIQYLQGRDWPLPTIAEFKTVQTFNELLAWVLVFGRRPNHFTLSIHLLKNFSNLNEFNEFIANDVKLPLNHEGGLIKGGAHTGIAQGSTTGIAEKVQLADGAVDIPTGFVEFVWRYPLKSASPRNDSSSPLWKDFFTGFVAQHADHVIESLYTE